MAIVDSAVPSESVWRDIRGLRADPPGLARERTRREVFAAALQQAEELHRAATVCGNASRALPLFYALSQGGRAIAAAAGPEDGWILHGHGMGMVRDQVIKRVTDARVKSNRTGAFPVLAQITGSSGLPEEISLGALLASLPEVSAVVSPYVDHTPTTEIFLDHETAGGEYMMLAPPLRMAAVYFGPEVSLSGQRLVDAMADRLAPYPRAAGWVIRPSEAQRHGRLGIGLAWPVEEDGRRGFKALDVVATHYRRSYHLRPALGDDGSEIDLLMTWWASLFALSSLTRYEPATWRAGLELDSSELAVILEEVLEVALERVPELLLQTLVEERAMTAALS